MYLVTFHSQFDSNYFARHGKTLGKIRQKPIPRHLSSSCGTCCVFEPAENLTDEGILEIIRTLKYERVYRTLQNNASEYELILEEA